MTTLVGIRLENKVWIGSDTLLTGNGQTFGHLSKTAIVPHDVGGDSCMAIAGPSTAIHAIQDTVAETSFSPWLSTLEVYKGLCCIHSYLDTNHFLKAHTEEDLAFASSGFESIIGNEHGLWIALSSREIIPVQRFCAVGSGREFALGALHSLNIEAIGAEAAIQLAMSAASAYDSATGSEVEIWSNDLQLKPAKPAARSRKGAKT